MSETMDPNRIDAVWEYGDPERSERRFRELAAAVRGDDRLELQTQIARALGLRALYAEAHALLDEVEKALAVAGPPPRVRYLLERGRVLNSSGESERARAFFLQAWESAKSASLEGLAVDAAHMLAIVSKGTQESQAWNERGLEMARKSLDPKAQALIPAMLNNSAWELHEKGEYQNALGLFEEARAAWEARGGQQQVLVAHWSVARCLRSLGRHAEALSIQKRLETEHLRLGTTDGYVFEEIAENLAAMGRPDEAAPYFARAHEALLADPWMAEHESDRLASLFARAHKDRPQ